METKYSRKQPKRHVGTWLFVVIVSLCVLRWRSIAPSKFDAEIWKAAGSREVMSGVRCRMADDLILVIRKGAGGSAPEVLALLGKPDVTNVREGGVGAVTRGAYVIYKLGRKNSFLPSGSCYLRIDFADGVRVSDIAVYPE